MPAKKRSSLAGAIKRPGALTRAVGGKPSQHMGAVKRLEKSGTPLQKKQASFYDNVLRAGSSSRSSKRGR